MIRNFLFGVFFLLGVASVVAQESDGRHSINLNEIEIWVKDVSLSTKGDTATVQLYLQSYLKNPRDFRLNTFASGLLNGSDKPMWYTVIRMGNVAVDIKDRQNYLNYLLTRDEAVVLTIKSLGWSKPWGKPKQVKLTFEDYEEEGKFLEFVVDL